MNSFYTKDIINQEFRQSVGDHTYGNPEISGRGYWNLKIGKYCSIAGGVRILMGGGHDLTKFSTYPFDNLNDAQGDPVWPTAERNVQVPGAPEPKIGVYIGNDVWIGCAVIILPGVTIGDGAVVGAGAVVAKDVEPYAVVVGNPIKTIRYRFEPDVIKKLLEMKWWDWSDEKVAEALPLLRDIEGFIKKYG